MADGIFLIGDDGALVEMIDTPYESESILQELLAQYPEVLAGNQTTLNSPGGGSWSAARSRSRRRRTAPAGAQSITCSSIRMPSRRSSKSNAEAILACDARSLGRCWTTRPMEWCTGQWRSFARRTIGGEETEPGVPGGTVRGVPGGVRGP
jgi:hypothetical protein